MSIRATRIVGSLLISALLCPPMSAAAQAPSQGAAYWQTYVSSMPLNSTLELRLRDGSRLKGRLIATADDDFLFRRSRAMRRDVEERVRFDQISELSRTHPTRDSVIFAVVAVGGLYLFVTAWAPRIFKG